MAVDMKRLKVRGVRHGRQAARRARPSAAMLLRAAVPEKSGAAAFWSPLLWERWAVSKRCMAVAYARCLRVCVSACLRVWQVTCVARNAPKANFLTCVTGGVTVRCAERGPGRATLHHAAQRAALHRCTRARFHAASLHTSARGWHGGHTARVRGVFA